MENLKTGQTIYKVEIKKFAKETNHDKSGVYVEQLRIIGISDVKVCLDDRWFTSLDVPRNGKKEKGSIYHYMNDINVRICVNHILSDGVFATLHSSKKPTKKTLQKMFAAIESKIDREYSFMFYSVKSEIIEMIDAFDL